MTVTRWTGFEYGLETPVTSGGGICNAVVGTPTITAAAAINGSYGLRIYVAGSAATQHLDITLTGTVVVGRISFKWHTATSGACRIVRLVLSSGTTPSIQFDPADNTVNAFLSTAGTKSAALAQDTEVTLDFKFDCSSATNTWDVKVNGSALPQRTYSQTVTLSGIYIGFADAVTGEFYYDDLSLSATAEDYPISNFAIEGLRPSGDGTHNNAANLMEDSGGNDINGTTYTAFDKLDESPWISTADTDYITQSTADTAGVYYAEVEFANTTNTTILGVSAMLQYSSTAATANTGGCVIIDEDSSAVTLWGAPGGLADYSETTAFYKYVTIPAPSGGWDQAAVNALKCRFGYGDDVAPRAQWLAVMLEVAYTPSSGTSTPMTLDGADTPSGTLVMEFDTTKAGTATPSGAVTKQIQTAKAGAVTPAGALTNQIQTTFAGGDTPSGSLVSQFATPKAGAATPSGALVMQLQRVLAGAIAPLGDLVKEIQTAFAGGATPSGVLSYIKARVDTFAGGATPAGALSRVLNFARTHGGEIVPSGEFTYVANVAPVVSADGGGLYGTIAQRRQLVQPTEAKEDDVELALLVAGWKILKGRTNGRSN